MDVKTVCLGMLTDGEASGYDMKKCFESSFSHFFAAGYGSIYPALASLAEDGLVNCREIPQEGKPDRKVYTITAAGRAELMRGLENSTPQHKVRSEFLAIIWFAHLLTDEQISTMIDNKQAEIEALLQMFESIEESGVCDARSGKQFVCGFGKTVTQAIKKYIEDNRPTLIDSDRSGARAASG